MIMNIVDNLKKPHKKNWKRIDDFRDGNKY